MKIITIHQPNYLPWIGFFSKVSCSDGLILTDVHPFTKRSVTHRNKVRTNEGWNYLTIPINKSYYDMRILDVELPADRAWMAQHWRTIRQNYIKTAYFNLYQGFFEELYKSDMKYLWQINEAIITYLLKCFEIRVPVIKASELGLDHELKKTDLLINILKNAGADIYLSGPSGRNYLELDKFPRNNIGLKFFKFQHPVYEQRYPGFEPEMSAIDLLFNLGPQASQSLKVSGSIVD